MQAFEFAQRSVKVVKATNRKENHGKGKKGKANRVQAITLRLRLEGTAADLLPLVSPTLHAALYWTPPHLAAQEKLDLPVSGDVHLRTEAIEMPLELKRESTGYTVTIEHGADDDLELYDCKLTRITVDAKEGGQAAIEWNVASSKEITPELLGKLCALEGDEVKAKQEGPDPDAQPAGSAPVIDGTTEAFRKDHPEFDFDAETGGAGEGDPEDDDEDGEGDAPDMTPERALAEQVAAEGGEDRA